MEGERERKRKRWREKEGFSVDNSHERFWFILTYWELFQNKNSLATTTKYFYQINNYREYCNPEIILYNIEDPMWISLWH